MSQGHPELSSAIAGAVAVPKHPATQPEKDCSLYQTKGTQARHQSFEELQLWGIPNRKRETSIHLPNTVLYNIYIYILSSIKVQIITSASQRLAQSKSMLILANKLQSQARPMPSKLQETMQEFQRHPTTLPLCGGSLFAKLFPSLLATYFGFCPSVFHTS